MRQLRSAFGAGSVVIAGSLGAAVPESVLAGAAFVAGATYGGDDMSAGAADGVVALVAGAVMGSGVVRGAVLGVVIGSVLCVAGAVSAVWADT